MNAEELELLTHKAPYLNVPWFLIRAAIYFAVWLLVSDRLRRWSLKQDEAPPAHEGCTCGGDGGCS